MNENEFAARVQDLRGSLYRTAYLYLGNEAAALDAVDEAVYRGLLSYKKLREPEYFVTWMTRILINECKTELRRRKRIISLPELPETSVEEYDALPIRDAVLRLPKELKEPVILRYFSGLTTIETAAALKIPQGTAATRIRRALSVLRLELSEEEVFNESK
ncbi:MAG: sigma-70 family RNA polymerase sigma factor [Oscillospiraceae bacterium]|nr:sigma-70 family RNA polymerase sigma factor [Oscillospiraceae bacterium]